MISFSNGFNAQSLLCFVYGDSSVDPSPLEDTVRDCAVAFWDGLCAADSDDDSCGCKAHACCLLVKRGFSARPSLCLHDALACCHNPGSELLDYCYPSCILQLVV